MKDGICTKKISKEFNPNTFAVFNGYPRYKHFDNERVVIIKGNQVDNYWVVPYNSWLSKKYQALINFEACLTIKFFKYLYKCIYKKHDCPNFLINEQINYNEINRFLNCRCVSALEVYWGIFEYSVSEMSHNDIRLQVYLPNNQMIYFVEGE